MSKQSLVDTGAAPAAVAAKRAKQKAILEDTVEDQLDAKQAAVKEADHQPSIGFDPAPKIKTFAAVLSHALYHITLEILDISISDFQVALKVPRNGCKFEPVPQSSFLLKTKGKKYNVTYLGGIFDFPSDEHWTITILMEVPPPDTDSLDEKILQAIE